MFARLGLKNSYSRFSNFYSNNGSNIIHSIDEQQQQQQQQQISCNDFLVRMLSCFPSENTLLTMLLLLKPPDAQALANLSFPLPENTLESVAGACGRVFSPFCRFIGSTLNSDVETLIQSLHEADPDFAATANGKYTVQVCPPILSPFGFNIS